MSSVIGSAIVLAIRERRTERTTSFESAEREREREREREYEERWK